MKNIILFPKLERSYVYQLKCTFLLTAVPLFCALILTALLFFFAQQNLYFLENGGMIADDTIRTAYQDQLIIELMDASGFLAMLFCFTFGLSYFLMGWAVSPFRNAERLLRSALRNEDIKNRETDWLSESPLFHKVVWGLAHRLKDPTYSFDSFDNPTYQYNFRFFLKFALSFYMVSLATGSVLGIMLNTVYTKIVNLAITLVRMNQKGHYFMAQEELLRVGVVMMVALSCIVYAVIGYYVTRYMSNMLFVFIRAVKEHHFPLKLRDSDVYHGLADAISDVTNAAGLSKK